MPLNIIEKNIDKVSPKFRALYVKKDESFHLDLSDLNKYVDTHLKPLKSELEMTRASERKTLLDYGFGSKLQKAGLRENYEELIFANFDTRVAIAVVDGKRTVRILQADGETPMVGSGPGGLATLDDLVQEVVKEFPSVFVDGGKPASNTEVHTSAKRNGITILRSEFDALAPRERAAKMAEGFAVVDDEPAAKPRRALTSTEMTRASFEQLSAVDRAARMKEGFTLVD